MSHLKPLFIAGAIILSAVPVLLQIQTASAETRVPFQRTALSSNCGASTFVCRVDLPAVPQDRRREITFAACHVQTDGTAQLNFLHLTVDSSGAFVPLIPVNIGSGGTKQFQSNDQVLLYLNAGEQLSIVAGLQTGQAVFSVSCFVSGETIRP